MRSQPIHHAPHSGYERLEAGTSLVVADVGACPPIPHSAEAGAGGLSFEFSSGRQRIIVNCGLPRTGSDDVVRAARSTPAHSTAALDDRSSCRFLEVEGWWFKRWLAGWLVKRLGPIVLGGPATVTAERSERDGAQCVDASHDGYRQRFGLVHERRWCLAAEGHRLDGEDLFHRDPQAADVEAVIRFHLAPGVKASRGPNGQAIALALADEAWEFEASTGEARLEDSVFFSAMEGSRRTEQIVLRVRPAATPSLRWRFERIAAAAEAVARQGEAAPEPA